MASRIRRNAVICNGCEEEIESRQPREPVWCKCRKTAVDGGNEFIRRIGENFTEVSEIDAVDTVPEETQRTIPVILEKAA